MSNRFSCEIGSIPDFTTNWSLSEPFLGCTVVDVVASYFFYCAQPNATSASIQNVKTNLREYYVKRLKVDYCYRGGLGTRLDYMMVFVLNVPQDYAPSKADTLFKLSDLPSHTMPENVLYYDFFHIDRSYYDGTYTRNTKNISIDIKKHFKVSPAYKLAFVYYLFSNTTHRVEKRDGTAQVFFDVN